MRRKGKRKKLRIYKVKWKETVIIYEVEEELLRAFYDQAVSNDPCLKKRNYRARR
jgi:hypothetical protein